MSDAEVLAPEAPKPGALVRVREPVSESAQILRALTTIARDKGADVSKLERIMALYERIKAADARQAYIVALGEAQAEMRPILTDADNDQTKSKYASFAALDRVLRPIYTRHGLLLSFNTETGAAPDYVRIVCHVSHREGHTETHSIDMPADGKGAKGGDVMTRTHATGAAITYGQRYLEKMIFNVATTEDDDDGNTAGAERISEAQRDALNIMADQAGADKRHFCQWLSRGCGYEIDSIAAIRARDYKKAERALAAKLAGAQP